MVNSLNELAEMISLRDNISLDEAWHLIDMTEEDIDYALASDPPSYEGAEDAVANNLGLEPDYLDLFFL